MRREFSLLANANGTQRSSPIKDVEIKVLLKAALTDDINSREVYMKGNDHSYHYEGVCGFQDGSAVNYKVLQ